MKIFMASFGTETNVFAPMPTGWEDFEECYFYRHDTLSQPSKLFNSPMHLWNKRAQEDGHEVICSLSTFAMPAGITVRHVYEELRDMVLDDLKAAGPVDIVLLSQHGAMIAQGYDDCEGDLMAEIRKIVGKDTIIGTELDLHGHLTDKMMDSANLLVFFKHYPHDDIDERADELYDLAIASAEKKITPVMRFWDCKMIAFYRTPIEPMASFVTEMKEKEKEKGVLSLSLCHGFPTGDMPDVGTRMLAVTDNDPDLATKLAEEFGRKIWDLRDDFKVDFPSIDTALTYAHESNKHPIVLADITDNAGGGAPSDSTFMLRAALEKNMNDVAIGIFWDPGVVRICKAAGKGAILDLCLGGKHGVVSGLPLNINAEIMNVTTHQAQAMGDGDVMMPLGTLVWLKIENNINILVNDVRNQALSRLPFLEIGIELEKLGTIIVKSSNHFFNSFDVVAEEIIHVSGPGAMSFDASTIPYTKRDNNYWPKIKNPHG